jgi:hypothetical protein
VTREVQPENVKQSAASNRSRIGLTSHQVCVGWGDGRLKHCWSDWGKGFGSVCRLCVTSVSLIERSVQAFACTAAGVSQCGQWLTGLLPLCLRLSA